MYVILTCLWKCPGWVSKVQGWYFFVISLTTDADETEKPKHFGTLNFYNFSL